MTEITSSDITTAIGNIVRNPKAAVGVSFNLLEQVSDGNHFIVSGENPLAYSLEMAVINTNIALTQSESMCRKLFPSMAVNMSDLYPHMADEDYLDRFATPSETVIGFVMPVNEVLGKAVPINDGTGAKALIIPRHSSVTVGDYIFTIQYPIIIKVMYNGTLSTYMDLSRSTPTYTPPTNILPHVRQHSGGTEWLMIEAPAQQVKITSTVMQTISFTGYSTSISYSDNFYHARAYIKDTSGTWNEIHVTHQDQVYNPYKPTVCIKVLNKSIDMYIPQVYFQNGTVKGSVRVDIYTTLGPLDVDLSKDKLETFKIKLEDFDVGITEYSSPLQRFASLTAFTRTSIKGGSGAKTFTQLYNAVTLRSAYTEGLPITTDQISRKVTEAGFTMLDILDNVTKKQYAATRQVDPPADKHTVTGLSCSMQNVAFLANDFVTDVATYTNTKRVTIRPEHLFMYDHGGIRKVADSLAEDMKAMLNTNPDGLATMVNKGQYYFTPYHYVLDMSEQAFDIRPYAMTSPEIVKRDLFQQNATLGINIVSNGYSIEYKADGSGYLVYVLLESNATLNALEVDRLSAQLTYTSGGDNSRTYINGRMMSGVNPETNRPIDGKWLYRFEILSDFDITRSHQFNVTNTSVPMDLLAEVDVTFIVKNISPATAQRSDIDNITYPNKLEDYDYLATYYGATQEKVIIRFGHHLTRLWRRSKTNLEGYTYRTYDEDVYAYYTDDVFVIDEETKVPQLIYNDKTGELRKNIKHAKGDPIMIDGKHVILHEKGSTMYGVDGEPIPVQSSLDLQRYIDILFVDGRYYFANNDQSTDYLQTATDTMRQWIVEDIDILAKRCLERTDIYYYPHVSTGLIDVIVGDGSMARIRADQTLFITYTLRREKYNSNEIRENLVNNSANFFKSALDAIKTVGGGVITKNDIIAVMKNILKEDVVDINIAGFLDDLYTAVLVSNVSSVPTIGKTLVTLSNLTLQVQDAVNVDFKILDKDAFNPYTLN